MLRSRLRIFFETLKCSSGHVDCSFDNPAENFFLQNPKIVRSMSQKKSWNYYVFQKTVFCSKMFFRTLSMQFWQLCQKFFAHSPKIFRKSKFFSKNIFFLKMFLWIRRMDFWQPYRKFFVKILKIFRSRSEYNRKIIIPYRKKFFL